MATIQQILSKEDCEKILRRSLDAPFHLLSYKINKFHDGVAGYLGDHFSVIIKFTINNIINQKSYFVKTTPQSNENQYAYVQDSGIFKKEVLLYQNLLSELLKISQFGPQCYLIKDANCMVFEDLHQKGYRMISINGYFTEELCFSLLRTLAKFHASTIIYENKWEIRLDQKFQNEIQETGFSFIEGKPRQKWCVNVTRCISDVIESMQQDNSEEICEKWEKFVFEKMPFLIKPSKRFRNVLTHNDLWCNNMLFNEKLECVFVDFQLVRYTPPAYDFLLTLFLNLEFKYFEENFERLKNIYYSSLENELKRKNLDCNDFLSKSEFDESLELYKIAALTEATMFGTQVYISEELSNYIMSDHNNFNEFTFLDRSKFVKKDLQENPEFRERLNNILIPLIQELARK